MTSAFSWKNSISPASFCTPRPNLPVTTGVPWLPTFTFQSPIMDKTGAYYTEWSKSERKTPIQYINIYIYIYIYMEFRKMVTMTLYARQQKRHRDKEQTFELCGRRRGWDDLRGQHWNMYITICEIDCQARFDALGWPWGMRRGGRWEGRFRIGDTCVPVANSCRCMAKATTIL